MKRMKGVMYAMALSFIASVAMAQSQKTDKDSTSAPAEKAKKEHGVTTTPAHKEHGVTATPAHLDAHAKAKEATPAPAVNADKKSKKKERKKTSENPPSAK